MTYNEKVTYISKLCNVFGAAIFDSHSCAAKDSVVVIVVTVVVTVIVVVIVVVVVAVVVPMADGGEVISSSLWHPSRV